MKQNKRKLLYTTLICIFALLFGFKITETKVSASMTETFYPGYVEYEIRAPFMELFGVTLEDPVEKEQKELKKQREEAKRKEAENKEAFQYVAFGNSLTWHESGTGFWWNECGMAASRPENDFVHKVAENIDALKDVNTEFKAISAKKWETEPENRSAYLNELGIYLNEDTDLVTIQLGDNATDNFEADYEILVNYVQNKAPNARIILIGLYMTSGEKEAYIPNVANRLGLIYIPLNDISCNDAYHNQMGAIVYDPQGNPHEINLPEVAFHPNDLGMECIANKITEALQSTYPSPKDNGLATPL